MRYLSISFIYFLVWMDNIRYTIIRIISIIKPAWIPPSVMITPLQRTQKAREVERVIKAKLFQISHFILNILILTLNHHKQIFIKEYAQIANPITFMIIMPIAEIMNNFLEVQASALSGKVRSISVQFIFTLYDICSV